jgi:hypothetical protein
MWAPRRLATLWASTSCYRDNFTFVFVNILYQLRDNWKASRRGWLCLGMVVATSDVHIGRSVGHYSSLSTRIRTSCRTSVKQWLKPITMRVPSGQRPGNAYFDKVACEPWHRYAGSTGTRSHVPVLSIYVISQRLGLCHRRSVIRRDIPSWHSICLWHRRLCIYW